MHARQWIIMGPVLGVTCILVACAGGAESAPPPSSPTSAVVADEGEDVAADLNTHHRHHHHGGVTMFIAMSLESLGVSPEQKAAIEKIQSDLYAKMEPSRLAEQNVANVIAEGIAAGGADPTKVEAALSAVSAAASALHDATTDALNQLHDKLTPEQRVALMDKVEANWEVWRTSNAAQEQPGQDLNHDGKVSPSEQSHLERLAKEIDLTPDQVATAQASFAAKAQAAPVKFDPAQVEAHVQELVAAFEAATFDAKTLARRAAAHTLMADYGARRMASFYLAVDPVLTPPQRVKLSAMIKEHAQLGKGAEPMPAAAH
jgi:Spy/CpxP family protein refolding chaperone